MAMISVVMPVYNAESFLNEAIESILNQTFGDFEFIIINNASTDNSKKIIHSYSDPRIKYIENDVNMGLVYSLNKGIDSSSGKYIARMDADDISMPERFFKQVNFLEQNASVGICGSWFENFGNITGISQYPADENTIRFKMLYQLPVLHPSVLIRKNILDKYGLKYNSNFKQGEDYDLFVRIAEVSNIANIPEVLIKYRQHTASIKSINNSVFAEFKNKTISNQFNNMGIEISDSEIALFSKLCYADFNFSKEDMILTESLLLRIIAANNNSGYINSSILTSVLCQKWFHLCYNLTRLYGTFSYNLYKKSQLIKFYSPDLIKMTIFKTRALIKK